MNQPSEPPAFDVPNMLRHRVESGLIKFGEINLLARDTFVQALRRPFEWRAFIEQVESIGVRSMSVVVLTAIFSSMVITIQFAYQLARFGAKEWAGNAVGVTLARELGPVMTALMVGGRVGAGIAAELGSMTVTEQVDAVRVLGADPIKKLVVPRVLAMLLVMPLMTGMAVVLGLVAGGVIASLEPDVRLGYFLSAALRSTTIQDFASGLFKSVFFAFNIAIVACRLGLSTRGGTVGVGRATTETVVITSVITLVSDFLMTKLFMVIGIGK